MKYHCSVEEKYHIRQTLVERYYIILQLFILRLHHNVMVVCWNTCVCVYVYRVQLFSFGQHTLFIPHLLYVKWMNQSLVSIHINIFNNEFLLFHLCGIYYTIKTCKLYYMMRSRDAFSLFDSSSHFSSFPTQCNKHASYMSLIDYQNTIL